MKYVLFVIAAGIGILWAPQLIVTSYIAGVIMLAVILQSIRRA